MATVAFFAPFKCKGKRTTVGGRNPLHGWPDWTKARAGQWSVKYSE